jgi:hypothetical protein
MTADRDYLELDELDELLRVVRHTFIARSDAAFDFEAGLSDVRERAGLPFALVPARRIPPGSGPLSAAVALVCEHVEELVVALDCLLLSGPLPDLVGSQIQRAADVLLQLRDQVATGTASLADAGSAFATVRDVLSQADLILRVEHGLSLPETLAGAGRPTGESATANDLHVAAVPEQRLEAALRQLEHEVSTALAAPVYDRADQHRRRARRASGQPRRRSAGGR